MQATDSPVHKQTGESECSDGPEAKQRKAVTKEKQKSIDELRRFHQARGHRSPEHTARMYENEAGYKLSAEATRDQARCEACNMEKI